MRHTVNNESATLFKDCATSGATCGVSLQYTQRAAHVTTRIRGTQYNQGNVPADASAAAAVGLLGLLPLVLPKAMPSEAALAEGCIVEAAA
jgi:hypothetical protein